MAELKSIVDIGKDLGYEGADLRTFVEGEQQRVEAAERERRHHERDIKKMELEIAEKKIVVDQANLTVNTAHNFNHKGLKLPYFDETHDNMDAYLERFERYSSIQEWDGNDKAIFLSTLLRGKALDVYSRLSAEEAKNYTTIKDALMRAFQLTEEGFKHKFFTAKPELNESPAQVIARMESYFDRWVELAGVVKDFNGIRQLLLKEQFISTVQKDLAIFIREHKPDTMSEIGKLADTFMDARGWRRLASDGRNSGEKQKGKSKAKEEKVFNRSTAPVDKRDIRCYNCQQFGHKSFECKSSVKRSNANGYHNRASSKTISSCVAVEDHVCSLDKSEAHLKCGCKVPMISSACNDNSLLYSLPIREGRIDGKCVMVMRDTGCNSVVIRKSLVSNDAMTGKQQKLIMVDRTIRSAPEAVVSITSPYYTGTVKALCIDNPICDVVIGNIDGATMGETVYDDVVQKMEKSEIITNFDIETTCSKLDKDSSVSKQDNTDLAVNVVSTRSKAGTEDKFKSLNVPKVIVDSVSVSELQKLQSEDRTLRNCRQKCMKVIEANTPNGFERYFMHKNMMYRFFSHAGDKGVKQLIVPKSLRIKVMSLGHESIMAGHMGISKTIRRITQNFYWPGIGADVRRFCLSCDHCQKTLPNTPVTPEWRPYYAATATENGSRACHGRHKRGISVVETPDIVLWSPWSPMIAESRRLF